MSDLKMILEHARSAHLGYVQAASIIHGSEMEYGDIFIDDDWLEERGKFVDVSDRFRFMDYVSECVTFEGLMHKCNYPRYLP